MTTPDEGDSGRAERDAVVREIVEEYLTSTGVGGGDPRRYLWNDAFAVCALLSLHGRTGDGRHLDAARRLVDEVHRVLGRHREDDERTGWISGLSEEEGARHPTAGGLRIGKPLPERRPDQPPDPDLEWERDGQYYHYLTRWMEALERLARATGEGVWLRHAVELARAAHRGFVRRSDPGDAPRMVWKMSIDLSRPLVASAGQHDPLDGFVVLQTLKAAARRRPGRGTESELEPELEDLSTLIRGREWATADPLGIGGLLGDLHGVDRLERNGDLPGTGLRERLRQDGARSLEAFARHRALDRPPQDRLAFRELGLALGLRAVEAMDRAAGPGGDPGLEPLLRYLPLAGHIEAFWLDPSNRKVPSWGGHRDINLIMLATALAPEGYLGEVAGEAAGEGGR